VDDVCAGKASVQCQCAVVVHLSGMQHSCGDILVWAFYMGGV
jgi:hypothetical protein